jgi:predicted membrane chloride channel (bestrophin family)
MNTPAKRHTDTLTGAFRYTDTPTRKVQVLCTCFTNIAWHLGAYLAAHTLAQVVEIVAELHRGTRSSAVYLSHRRYFRCRFAGAFDLCRPFGKDANDLRLKRVLIAIDMDLAELVSLANGEWSVC